MELHPHCRHGPDRPVGVRLRLDHDRGESGFTSQIVTSGQVGTTETFVPSGTGARRRPPRFPGGEVTTSGTLAAGMYVATGSDSDGYGDSGGRSYTLTVGSTTISQTSSSEANSTTTLLSQSFTDSIYTTGQVGATEDFAQSGPSTPPASACPRTARLRRAGPSPSACTASPARTLTVTATPGNGPTRAHGQCGADHPGPQLRDRSDVDRRERQLQCFDRHGRPARYDGRARTVRSEHAPRPHGVVGGLGQHGWRHTRRRRLQRRRDGLRRLLRRRLVELHAHRRRASGHQQCAQPDRPGTRLRRSGRTVQLPCDDDGLPDPGTERQHCLHRVRVGSAA